MNEYVICTDSCTDLDMNMLVQMDVEVRPMILNMNGKSYANWPDGREIASEDFYAQLRKGSTASTSQINTAEFIDFFRPFLENGKDVLYLGFSSGLSGTLHSAELAAEELAIEFTDNKVVVVDTLAASLGQGLLVWYAAQQKKQGKALEEVARWVEDHRLNLAHWFTVDDLNFLKRGGRLSGAAALFGTMLSIKPVLHVDNEGHLIAMEKVRGRKRSLLALVDHMEKTGIEPGKQMIFISHGDCLEDAEFVAEEIKKRFGTQDLYINYIGPVIGSHSGPGTMAVFFMASER